MVTGYTCRIADGRITKLSDFALLCAEQFIYPDWSGRLVDDDLEYHAAQLKVAKENLDVWYSMSNDERFAMYQHELGKWRQTEKERDEELKRMLDRYKAIEFQLSDWNPPKILENLKSFMRQQLKSSIETDCQQVRRDYPTYDDWLQVRERCLNNDLSLAESSHTRAQVRVQKQNEFIRALYESFGMEVPQE